MALNLPNCRPFSSDCTTVANGCFQELPITSGTWHNFRWSTPCNRLQVSCNAFPTFFCILPTSTHCTHGLLCFACFLINVTVYGYINPEARAKEERRCHSVTICKCFESMFFRLCTQFVLDLMLFIIEQNYVVDQIFGLVAEITFYLKAVYHVPKLM